MAEILEIDVSIEELEARKERLARVRRFEKPDRVPVLPSINYRYLLPKIGVPFRDYYADPEVMLRSQILAQKWLLENVKTDQYSLTGAWVGGWTDFQNAGEPSAMGCKVVFPEDDIVWAEGGWVRDDSDLETLRKMDIVHGGLHGRSIEYRKRMMEAAHKYPVRFKGGDVFYPGENPVFTHTSDGPFTNAAVLMGHTEIFLAVLERLDFVRELLEIVTDKILEWLDFCWEELQIPNRDFAFTDDSAAGLSPAVYEEIVLPEDKRLRDHFDGWVMLHMCGRTAHLLEYFRDDLRIHEFQGFGWAVPREKVAEVMAGRVVLLGNVDPRVIRFGTPEEVKRETLECLEIFAPLGGYIVQDGNNIAPGTPVENINAMTEAAEEFAGWRP